MGASDTPPTTDFLPGLSSNWMNRPTRREQRFRWPGLNPPHCAHTILFFQATTCGWKNRYYHWCSLPNQTYRILTQLMPGNHTPTCPTSCWPLMLFPVLESSIHPGILAWSPATTSGYPVLEKGSHGSKSARSDPIHAHRYTSSPPVLPPSWLSIHPMLIPSPFTRMNGSRFNTSRSQRMRLMLAEKREHHTTGR